MDQYQFSWWPVLSAMLLVNGAILTRHTIQLHLATYFLGVLTMRSNTQQSKHQNSVWTLLHYPYSKASPCSQEAATDVGKYQIACCLWHLHYILLLAVRDRGLSPTLLCAGHTIRTLSNSARIVHYQQWHYTLGHWSKHLCTWTLT